MIRLFFSYLNFENLCVNLHLYRNEKKCNRLKVLKEMSQTNPDVDILSDPIFIFIFLKRPSLTLLVASKACGITSV